MNKEHYINELNKLQKHNFDKAKKNKIDALKKEIKSYKELLEKTIKQEFEGLMTNYSKWLKEDLKELLIVQRELIAHEGKYKQALKGAGKGDKDINVIFMEYQDKGLRLQKRMTKLLVKYKVIKGETKKEGMN